MVAQACDMPHLGVAVGNEIDLLIFDKPFQVTVEATFVIHRPKCQPCLATDIGDDAVPPHRCALVVAVECVNGAAMHG